MTRVVLHIDRLVLTGFPQQDRQALAEGLRQELGRLFAEPDVAQGLAARGDVGRLEVSGIRVRQDAAPANVGAQAARGIVRGIGS
jgi:hypothetical protein